MHACMHVDQILAATCPQFCCLLVCWLVCLFVLFRCLLEAELLICLCERLYLFLLLCVGFHSFVVVVGCFHVFRCFALLFCWLVDDVHVLFLVFLVL